MIQDIERLCKKKSEIPTFIFDLKGILPRINKIYYGLHKLTLKRGETVKFCCGDGKINDPEFIYIDRNITSSIEEGDRIIADSSGLILKVVKISFYKREKSHDHYLSPKKIPLRYKNMPSFNKADATNLNMPYNSFIVNEATMSDYVHNHERKVLDPFNSRDNLYQEQELNSFKFKHFFIEDKNNNNKHKIPNEHKDQCVASEDLGGMSELKGILNSIISI